MRRNHLNSISYLTNKLEFRTQLFEVPSISINYTFST